MASLEVSSPKWSRRIDLGTESITVGRHPENGIQFNDDGLSRRHCAFEPVGDGWMVRDLGSRNGTKVNGVKVPEAPLNPGDIIRVGVLEIRYIEEPKPAAKSVRSESVDSRAGAGGGGAAYERALRRACEASVSKQFGEQDISLVDARGTVMHAAASLGDGDDDTPAESVRLFRLLILACFRSRASDLHIEPKTDKATARIRIDGVMVTLVDDLPLPVFRKVIGVVRVLCQFDQSVKAEVLDGHFNVIVKGRRVDYRVSLTRTSSACCLGCSTS